MAAVLEGDHSALGVLVGRYHGPLFGYLYRLVAGDRPVAEDLVQETMLRLLRRRTYERGRPFKPWLYTIATNLAPDHFKSAASRQVVRLRIVSPTRPHDAALAVDPTLEEAYLLTVGAHVPAAQDGIR